MGRYEVTFENSGILDKQNLALISSCSEIVVFEGHLAGQ